MNSLETDFLQETLAKTTQGKQGMRVLFDLTNLKFLETFQVVRTLEIL